VSVKKSVLERVRSINNKRLFNIQAADKLKRHEGTGPMSNLKNAPTTTLYNGLALMAGVLLFLGCANGSPLSLSGGNLFGNVADSPTAANLKVSESYSTSTQWFESYENAHRESLRTGKPLLAVFSGSDWCGPCIQLKRNVFESAEFKQWAADKVVLLELDFPKNSPQDPKLTAQNQRLADKYNVQGYPTVLFLDSNGNVLGKQGHGKDPRTWVAAADRTLR